MSKPIDITGKQFNQLIAIKKAVHTDPSGHVFWLFRCVCGHELEVRKDSAISGKVRDCGCIREVDTIGRKFSKLTAIKKVDSKDVNRWLFKCECGNEKIIAKSSVILGKTKSCGCSRVPRGKNSSHFTGHEGISGSSWGGIKVSARDRNIPFDITIEEAWQKFLDQKGKCALSGIDLKFNSLSRLFDGNASLDRIDSSKDYTIDNVQWVDKYVNISKQDLSDEEFIEMCRKIVKHADSKISMDLLINKLT